MADERYEWLDHEAAERLLRGEPVDADDDYSRWQVERLSEALDGARHTTGSLAAGPSGELPGEEAALTAFRAARSTRAAKPQVTAGSDLGSVRIGAALRPRFRPRPGGWMRPARWGLAASVAGLAVGGVAVAANTGVLPTFGGHKEPLPAASASAPVELDAPAKTPRGSAGPGTPADPGGPPATPPGPSAGAAGTPTAGGAAPDDNDGSSTGGTAPGDWGRTATRAPDGTWPVRVTQACRDFRDGRLDTARRQQLELAAKGNGGVQNFCDQVQSGGGRQPGGTTSGGTASGGTGTVGGVPGTGAVTGGAGAGTGTGTGTGGAGGGDSDGGDSDADRGGKGTGGKGAAGKGAGGKGTADKGKPPGAPDAKSPGKDDAARTS
ncbi:hypothetical protein [Streptomyces roseolilacinus]|uniref:Uncharacterized protein n=1 Tax=Streptomyces roseolilacinus TaxID=66904 RepID=A0A918EJF7_9ACTN|nr:hypothetical protein [Streptomyces roseolilacinus]GGP90151.1 hypothetical protein GCM10010249_05190 [Streptomyces roseolilacinus]